MSKFLVLIIASVFCATLIGCQTTYRAGKGAAEGARQDWNDSCKGFKGADNWIKKNLW